MNDLLETRPATRSYSFCIGSDEAFAEKYQVNDPIPTGRQILQAAGRRPEKAFMLLLLTSTDDLEEIGLDETVDLRKAGSERFFVFESDRLLSFEIDDRRLVWGSETIAEHTLKFLAGVSPDYTVWQERRGEQDDLRIDPGTFANLANKGVEVFFTGKDQTNAG